MAIDDVHNFVFHIFNTVIRKYKKLELEIKTLFVLLSYFIKIWVMFGF